MVDLHSNLSPPFAVNLSTAESSVTRALQSDKNQVPSRVESLNTSAKSSIAHATQSDKYSGLPGANFLNTSAERSVAKAIPSEAYPIPSHAENFTTSTQRSVAQKIQSATYAAEENIVGQNTAKSVAEKSSHASLNCVIIPPKKNKAVPGCAPKYMATYPGSGSEMTRKLIEALTGIQTKDVYSPDKPPRKPFNYVVWKTHAPMGAKPFPGVFPDVIILLRSPLDAIPSYGNWVWEQQHKKGHHTTQATESDWIKYRDETFSVHLDLWKQVLEYWLDHYDPSHRLIMQYERLTDEETGPGKATELAKFLGNMSSVPESDIPCFWRKVVAGDGGGKKKHRKKSYVPMYTMAQLNNVTTCLDDLYRKYEDETLRLALADYQKIVSPRVQRVS